MAKGIYSGEIKQMGVNQTNLYHRQWGALRYDRKGNIVHDQNGKPKFYVLSETILRENGQYVRKHQYICGCGDWIKRRQKLRPPYDQCKHIDALVRDFIATNQIVVGDQVFGRIAQLNRIKEAEFDGYQPFKIALCTWSGTLLSYHHIIKIPARSIPINIQDERGYEYCVGYLKDTSAYIALNGRDFDRFNHTEFFNVISNRSFTPNESEIMLQMEEQRNRMEKNFGLNVTNESFVFDGEFDNQDKAQLNLLVRSGTIDGYQLVGTSIVLKLSNREIKINNRTAWKGDYLVIVGKFPTFSIMGKNIQGSNYYQDNTTHPHVSSDGLPCLSSYNDLVVRSIQDRQWLVFATTVADFLSQYNPSSPYIRISA